MGISDIRLRLNRADVTMRYADGGKKQVFTIGDKTVELPASASTDQIVAAITLAIEHNPMNVNG